MLAPLVVLELGTVVAAGVLTGAMVDTVVSTGALVSLGAVVGAMNVGTGGIVGLVQATRTVATNNNDTQHAELFNFIIKLHVFSFLLDETQNTFVPTNPIFTNNSAL